ncbi:MAG: alanine--tRNA ligase [Candidatus Omnitrophica bacterium]|nr:alanine--tRNA ligase [Candidatus Omnitrophota bacterium]
MQADILREKFLKFFESKGHKIVESDSLIPCDDPTVLFTPAGMNQFKREFLGLDSGFKRATTSQRCLRTDDLEKVGKTSSHHTFFEMLGNFSFGDYFKEEAISWAWEFLTRELKIKTDRLWVSVYKDDDEAYVIWKDKIGLPEKKIVRLGDKDNFWPAEAKAKGPNGPCGPCSEIFYDTMEIWNLVFTQFNRKENGELEPLPNKNIDTGMGLERLTAIMEGKENNFETELFQPIIKEIKREASLGIGGLSPLFYAIADHIRAVVFSVYDGVMPSNEGRGYVIRKIIRKSILHLRRLGIDKPFLNKLVPQVSEAMREPYPGLKDKQEAIAAVILNEENNFINTLDSTDSLFKEKFSGFSKKDDAAKAGRVVFELYDTYGIPLDLTKEWLNAEGIKFSEGVFQEELNAQKERSRVKSSMKGDVFDAKGLGLKLKETKFCGYNEDSIKANIEVILKGGKEVKEAAKEEMLQIILDRTCFYPESGGQVGDTGELINGDSIFEVLDTEKKDNIILHTGKVKSGIFKKGDSVTAAINGKRRLSISRNHTATHILQAALRKVLGEHVQQQGSLVAEEKFRFDFTHFKGLSREEIKKVEEVANGYINGNLNVEAKEMELKEARKTNALAFFGEKYGEKVRVVSVGGVSIEFCGGAHLKNTKDIELIKIIQEGSVASGIRRIEGVTADYARKFMEEESLRLDEENKKKERLGKEKEKEKQESAKLSQSLRELAPKIIERSEKINGINLIFSQEQGVNINALRKLTDFIKEKAKLSIIALGSKDNDKAFLVIAVTEDLFSQGIDALTLIRKISPVINGSGGGRKDFAQAGGSKPENFTLAFEELKGIIINLGKSSQ